MNTTQRPYLVTLVRPDGMRLVKHVIATNAARAKEDASAIVGHPAKSARAVKGCACVMRKAWRAAGSPV